MQVLKVIVILLFVLGCNSEPINNESGNTLVSNERTNVDAANHPPEVKGGLGNLPEWGAVSLDYDKYYPGILDTIIDRRITMANRVIINPEDGIIVSILHNHGTFDQMFLCTHDSLLNLLDTYYIGTSTMWDEGESHGIEKEIINDSTIIFHHCDMGYNKDYEIDTLKYYTVMINVQHNGIIIERK